MARTLINCPKEVRRGEEFDIRVLIAHPMESGQRHDDVGQLVPRFIIRDFTCTYGGEEVLRIEMFPAIAANPFLSFAVTAQESGTLAMTFIDDHGVVQTDTVSVTVE
jgi:sulfur-oxidizing protein SoxZ